MAEKLAERNAMSASRSQGRTPPSFTAPSRVPSCNSLTMWFSLKVLITNSMSSISCFRQQGDTTRPVTERTELANTKMLFNAFWDLRLWKHAKPVHFNVDGGTFWPQTTWQAEQMFREGSEASDNVFSLCVINFTHFSAWKASQKVQSQN